MSKNKDKIRSLLAEIRGDESKPKKDISAILGNVINEFIKENEDGNVEEFIKIRREIENRTKTLSNSIEEIKSLISNGSERNESEISKIRELFEKVSETIGGIENAYGVDIQSLSQKISGLSGELEKISGSHKIYEQEVSLKHSAFSKDFGILNNLVNSFNKKGDEIDGKHSKNFIQILDKITGLEGELKKFSKDVYEFGSQMQILVNGILLGQSSMLNFKNGSGTTVTSSTNSQGVLTIQINTISGSNVVGETPSGSVNGSNQTFILANTPTIGTVKLYVNGQRMAAGGIDYTISGKIITLTIAPITGSIIVADYEN